MKNGLGNKQVMATNIRYYLSKLGLTATKVCEDLNIPSATFSNWCTAKIYPRIDKIEMLANYFGCTKADLVEDKEETMNRLYDIAVKKVSYEKLISLYNSLSKEGQEVAINVLIGLVSQYPAKSDDYKEA